MTSPAVIEYQRSALGPTTGGGGARCGDVTRFLATATAAAGLCAPLVGVFYGIVRVGYEEYYSALGLTPEVAGLGQAAIVSGVGVLVGLLAALIATWVMFAIVVYRLLA